MLKFLKKILQIDIDDGSLRRVVEEEGLPKPARDPKAVPLEDLSAQPWIAVDLDGTLAEFDYWRGFDHIGAPIPLMMARVRFWLDNGYNVKIYTARASVSEGIPPIKRWLAANNLPPLEITNQKDFDMIELWDDRAIQVVANTGKPFLAQSMIGRPKAPILPNEDSDSTFYLLRRPQMPRK